MNEIKIGFHFRDLIGRGGNKERNLVRCERFLLILVSLSGILLLKILLSPFGRFSPHGAQYVNSCDGYEDRSYKPEVVINKLYHHPYLMQSSMKRL